MECADHHPGYCKGTIRRYRHDAPGFIFPEEIALCERAASEHQSIECDCILEPITEEGTK